MGSYVQSFSFSVWYVFPALTFGQGKYYYCKLQLFQLRSIAMINVGGKIQKCSVHAVGLFEVRT